jgi:hypothetical protein
MSLTLWLSRHIANRADRQLERENARLSEDLEQERVKNRLLQLEVEMLAAIHARDVSRWQVEHPIKVPLE